MSNLNSSRPIIITANSSYYLVHYRELLIKNLSKKNHIITISPKDTSSNELSKLSINLPWRIDRRKDRNPFSFIISLLRMSFLIRATKPKMVHSHTLRTNLIIAIVCSFHRIPCILSFTGLGILSKENESKLIFKIILKTIMFFSTNEIKGFILWKKNLNRSRFIFQNQNDLLLFSSINKQSLGISKVIYGSGIPNRFFDKKYSTNSFSLKANSKTSLIRFQFIYCARLLISKGIKTFLKIANNHPDHDFIIYGDFDISSTDSIKKSDFLILSKKKNIYFKGYINNPLLTIDYKNPILVVPSNYGEGLPRAILEAFSLKIPVVCSPSATINLFKQKHLYIANENIFNNYQIIIDQINNEFKNGRLKKKIDKAYNFSKKLTEKKIINQTLNLYSELLNY